MTLYGIDISHHNSDDGFNLSTVINNVDFVIAKATGGSSYVDKQCDKYVQICRANGKLWGFYHFGHDGKSTADAVTEADFFVKNCVNYFGEGIPILDWERDTMSVAWVNKFLQRVYDLTKVWCWVYGNPWRFNQGGVNPECDRWIAQYPKSGNLTFSTAPTTHQKTDGLVCAWQFTETGRVSPWTKNLDLNKYYGSVESWGKYARGDRGENKPTDPSNGEYPITIEDDSYKVTVEKK